MQQDYKYKAFISYSHADRKWGNWLHRALETYRLPKYLIGRATPAGPVPERLTPIFRDREELASSHDLSERIRGALEESENLVLICSPSAARSPWVNREVEIFKELGRSERIFPFIVGGDPAAAGANTDCFPPALRTRYDRDGAVLPGQAEPIAADARKDGDGRALARLKVVAGLIQVGLDDLRQREQQRKQRRMAAMTASSLAATVVTVFLAIMAMLARDEADQRRQQAEDLLSFMVGDLRGRLEPMGRLDLLEEVGIKAMEYFATVKIGNLSDTELSRQAQIITQLGEIRVSELQYADALAAFTEAYDRSAALYRNSPGDGERLFDRGQAEFWVAFVHWRSGDFDEAREWLIRYRDSSVELANLDPTRDDWAQEVAYGHHNLAVLDEEAGNIDAAQIGFNRELDTLHALQERNESLDRRLDIADAVSWLGNIAVRRGDLIDALAYYERSAAELKLLSQAEPDNRSRQYNGAYAALRVAEIASITGEIDRAEDLVDEAMRTFNELASHDPDNSEWQRASTKPPILKGFLMVARNHASEAQVLADQSIERLKQLDAAGTADYNVREHLADAYSLVAQIDSTNGDYAGALASNQWALDNLQMIENAGRLDDERTGKLASAFVFRGELYGSIGDTTAANKSWQDAAEVLESGDGSARSHFLLDPWVRLLILTDRSVEAGAVRDTLDANRYKPLIEWPD